MSAYAKCSWWLVALCLHGSVAAAGEVIPATLDWAQRLVLTTAETGMIRDVHVAEGDLVSAGQVLLQLDQRGYVAAIKATSAARDAEKLALAEAARERDRLQELYDRTLLSDHDLQLGLIAYARAEAAYLAAEAALEKAHKQQRMSAVRAPFAGRVLVLHRHAGQATVNRAEAEPLLELAAPDEWLARADVAPAHLVNLEPGGKLQVRVGGHSVEGTIRSIVPAVAAQRPDGQRYVLSVVLPRQAGLRAGMRAEIELP